MRCALSGLIGAVLVVAGCVGGGSQDPPSDRTSYPEGPYGVGEGDIIEDLLFVDADDAEFSLGDLFADPANRLLLLSTAAGWCAACIEEQPSLEALYADHKARGLRVLVSVFEYSDFRPADAALAEAWQEEHEVSFDVVADPPFVLDAYYDSSATPMNMMVDIDTMEIVRITTGWDPTVIESIIEARLPK
jgi:thiol-disulfide isomerase/thioredoxin